MPVHVEQRIQLPLSCITPWELTHFPEIEFLLAFQSCPDKFQSFSGTFWRFLENDTDLRLIWASGVEFLRFDFQKIFQNYISKVQKYVFRFC